MEITEVRAIPLSDPVPEEKRHRTDLGTKVKTDQTFIFVETDEGLTGRGATLRSPPTIKAIVESELAPLLVGEDPMFTEKLWEKMYNGSRWKPSIERGYSQPRKSRRGLTLEAISGIDIALWDLKSQILKEPIYKILGATRDSIQSYGSGGWAPGEAAGEELAGYVDDGHTAVKMRVVGEDGFSIENTVNRVRAVRETIGPDIELMIDAHGSLNQTDAIKLAHRLEQFDLDWFEEPISPDDHEGLAEVREQTEIPIATGEREFTRFDFRSLLDNRSVDIIQPDVARAGGFTEIRRIAAMASARGVRVAPHAWGSGILFAASIHLGMSLPNCHILEVSEGYMPMLYELFEEDFPISDGRVYPPEKPGLGFTLRDDWEDRFEYESGPEYVF